MNEKPMAAGGNGHVMPASDSRFCGPLIRVLDGGFCGRDAMVFELQNSYFFEKRNRSTA